MITLMLQQRGFPRIDKAIEREVTCIPGQASAFTSAVTINKFNNTVKLLVFIQRKKIVLKYTRMRQKRIFLNL